MSERNLPDVVANKVESVFDQVDVSAKLIALGIRIRRMPEPDRSDLQALFKDLEEAILQHFATAITRDELILKLVHQQQVDTQYIVFDLEATKREKAKLEERINNILGEGDDTTLQE